MEAHLEYTPITAKCTAPVLQGRAVREKRDLDNAAIIFPSVATFDDPHVYRVTCILHKDVEPAFLQRALEDILPHFKAFSVQMIKGVFWRRFEKSNAVPAVREDQGAICSFFDQGQCGQHLFRILYSGSSIHMEAFHSLTDGVGAMRFVKALVYRYCQLAYSHQLHHEHRFDMFGLEHAGVILDGYACSQRAPVEKCAKGAATDRATHQIKGDLLGCGMSRLQTEAFPVDALKSLSRHHGVTLGVYLTAAIVNALYEEFGVPEGEALGICVPVNLRPVFELDTALNFFSNIIVQVPYESLGSFESTVVECKRQFVEKATKERLHKAISATVCLAESRLAKMTPLRLKDPILRLAYRHAKKKRTATFSNLGTMSVLEPFKPFVKGFFAIVSTSPKEPIRLAACSFDGELILACISKMRDEDVMGRLSARFHA